MDSSNQISTHKVTPESRGPESHNQYGSLGSAWGPVQLPDTAKDVSLHKKWWGGKALTRNPWSETWGSTQLPTWGGKASVALRRNPSSETCRSTLLIPNKDKEISSHKKFSCGLMTPIPRKKPSSATWGSLQLLDEVKEVPPTSRLSYREMTPVARKKISGTSWRSSQLQRKAQGIPPNRKSWNSGTSPVSKMHPTGPTWRPTLLSNKTRDVLPTKKWSYSVANKKIRVPTRGPVQFLDEVLGRERSFKLLDNPKRRKMKNSDRSVQRFAHIFDTGRSLGGYFASEKLTTTGPQKKCCVVQSVWYCGQMMSISNIREGMTIHCLANDLLLADSPLASKAQLSRLSQSAPNNILFDAIWT